MLSLNIFADHVHYIRQLECVLYICLCYMYSHCIWNVFSVFPHITFTVSQDETILCVYVYYIPVLFVSVFRKKTSTLSQEEAVFFMFFLCTLCIYCIHTVFCMYSLCILQITSITSQDVIVSSLTTWNFSSLYQRTQ